MSQAVVLLSGGLDSTTVLAIARAAGFTPLPLTFRYGQRHEIEVARAQAIAARAGLDEHLVITLPFAEIGGSSLLGDGEVPDEGADAHEHGGTAIPSTYVPARNLVFLALAVAVAEARDIGDVYIGVNALDYSGYPDCRPEFIEAFARAATLGTRAGVERDAAICIRAPLSNWSKARIIQRGLELGVDYALTVSCYRAGPDGLACGRCESCSLRRRGFAEAGVPDPTRYASPA